CSITSSDRAMPGACAPPSTRRCATMACAPPILAARRPPAISRRRSCAASEQRGRLGLLAQSVRASLGNHAVLIGGHAGHTDAADDLAVDGDGQSALDRACAAQAEHSIAVAALGHHVLEHLRGPAVYRSRNRLVLSDLDAASL